jgi:hypothetical protein
VAEGHAGRGGVSSSRLGIGATGILNYEQGRRADAGVGGAAEREEICRMVGTHATIQVEEPVTAERTPQKKYTVKVFLSHIWTLPSVKRAALAYRCCSSLPLRGQQFIVHKLNSSEFLAIKKLFPLVERPCHYSREFENLFPIVAGAIFKSSMLGFQLVAAKPKQSSDNIEFPCKHLQGKS